MKKFYKDFLFFTILGSILFFFVFVPEINSIVKDEKYYIGAHRGNTLNYTENSFEAIESALNNPDFTFIEFDVRYTKDQRVVLHHDDLLLRNHESINEISNLNYSELQNYTDYHVPLLEDVLDLVKNEKKLIIEIKGNDNESMDYKLVDDVVYNIIESNLSENDVMIASISNDIINYTHHTYPQFNTGLVFWLLPISYIDSEDVVKDFYDEVNADYLLLHSINLRNYENLIDFKPKNVTLLFWDFEEKMYLIKKDKSDKLWKK